MLYADGGEQLWWGKRLTVDGTFILITPFSISMNQNQESSSALTGDAASHVIFGPIMARGIGRGRNHSILSLAKTCFCSESFIFSSQGPLASFSSACNY